MKEIQEDPDLELQIIATGMHLSPEFGLTYRQIEKDGFKISKKIILKIQLILSNKYKNDGVVHALHERPPLGIMQLGQI